VTWLPLTLGLLSWGLSGLWECLSRPKCGVDHQSLYHHHSDVSKDSALFPHRERGTLGEHNIKDSVPQGSASRSLTKGRVPHISLVFREMWDSTEVDR
jgi:hypothetical protein